MNKVEKIKAYLDGMSKASCCPEETKKIIKRQIIPYIDSLKDEPISSNNLETELDKYIQDKFIIGENDVYAMGKDDMLAMIKHFLLKKEPVNEDLEKEHRRFLQEEWFNKPGKTISEIMFLIAQHFVQWQKEQMLKDVKESEVVITNKGILLSDLRIEDFDYEDKVRIIIVKEN